MKKEQAFGYISSIVKHPDRFAVAVFSELARFPIPIQFAMIGESKNVEGILPDAISRYMYLMEGIREYEPETTEIIRRVVKSGDTVMVAGAHIGVHAILAKQKAGEAGIVVGFEPTPNTYQILKRNCANRNIITEPVAITGGAESVEMTIFDVRHSAWNSGVAARTKTLNKWSPRTITVSGVTIDKYCSAKQLIPNVLILDLENGEMDALKGGEQTIHRITPRILIECGDLGRSRENSTNACLSLLSEWGYNLFEPDRSSNGVRQHKIMTTYPDDYQNILAVHNSDILANSIIS